MANTKNNHSNKRNTIEQSILTSAEAIRNSTSLITYIENAIDIIAKCINRGNKVILFGNGGSAADAQHIAAELIGKFKINRRSYPAIALTGNSSITTSLSNDYSFDILFSRQCESLVSKGDVVMGISTSGLSENVKKGLLISKKKGAITIGLLGNNGGSIKNLVDISLIVNSTSTPHIQEVHRVIYHIICEEVEKICATKK